MKTSELEISTCPTCGSSAIEKVCKTWMGTHRGQTYSVSELEFYSCPSCGERVYPPEAMRRIQAASPAYSKSAA